MCVCACVRACVCCVCVRVHVAGWLGGCGWVWVGGWVSVYVCLLRELLRYLREIFNLDCNAVGSLLLTCSLATN